MLQYLQPLLAPLFPDTLNTKGGVVLRDWKHLSSGCAIARLRPGPVELAIPLGAKGRDAVPCVRVGQLVCKGDVIAHGHGMAVTVHASTSGIIRAIRPIALAGQREWQMAIWLQADGEDRWGKVDIPTLPSSRTALAELLRRMGIVGMGGAGFPTGIKLGSGLPPHTLLVNGAECEPFLTCDDRLMQERSRDVMAGVHALATALQVDVIRVGIEDNKPTALRRMRRHSGGADIVALPTRYPAGSQPQLVQSLSGIRLAAGEHPGHHGLAVVNVATAYAIGRALLHGKPLTSRIVTVTGHVERPQNLEVPIGMPIRRLLRAAGPRSGHTGIHVGGPMMGSPLEHQFAVAGKTTSCLIVRSPELFPERGPERACIRCTRCADACPMALQPLALHAAVREGQRGALAALRLDACIECGACSHVCPSHIPLHHDFRVARRAHRS
ncbi:electron transport complex subunit RsxC [Chitinibacteraceae bacterium HSL-7]